MGKHYTEKEKKEAVRALALNGMDYHLTSKQLNIGMSSLQRWQEKYPEILNKGEKALTAQIVKKGDDMQQNFLETVMTAKELAIGRIINLIPKEKSLRTLLSVVETLDNLTEGNGDSSVNVESIFMQINNQMKDQNE